MGGKARARGAPTPPVFVGMLLAAFAVLAGGSAQAHFAVAALAPASCAGKADGSFDPPLAVTGELGTEVEGGYVLVPFDVPAGTTAVRVKYCHDQPEAPTSSQIKHVLDLGIYDARGPDGVFGEDEFRGWGGSSHPDVTVSPNGFSDDATYIANPKQHVHGKTTRGFEPGPIPAGEWAVELGAAAIASQNEGDSDGKVAWRVEIAFSQSSSWSAEPYQAAAYDPAPADPAAGWYAGDFHVHAEHSSLGDATMRETFDYAFAPLARDCGDGCTRSGAGLDFITLSDYVTDSGWGEIGRFQGDYPGKQVVRSSEIITYRGHANNHASLRYVDYRTGPVYERDPHGDLQLVRAARPASALFDGVLAGDGFTQINHPTIFPSEVPGFDFLCRGCPWDYTDAETDYTKVDAVEIATGPAGLKEDPQPGPNPFTPLAIQFWEHAIDANGPNANKIAAVASSDSHRAGCERLSCDPVTQTPIGVATTVVYADELSEKGIQRGVEARHTYVKVFGNDGPDLRLEAREPGSAGPPAIMGDTVSAPSAEFTARVLGAGPSAARPGGYELYVLKDGLPILSAPVLGDDFTLPFPSVGNGRYRLQLQRGPAIEAVSSPIWLEAPAADVSISKSDAPDPAFVGGSLTYTLSVANEGPSPAAGVGVVDELPEDVGFEAASTSQGSCGEASGTVTCSLGQLAAGASATVEIRVTAGAEGTLANSASVSASTPDPDPSDNADAEATRVFVGYPRPNGAAKLRVALVPAVEPCAAPNSGHGPPLAQGSCSPAVPSSAFLTVPSDDGSVANGSLTARVFCANGEIPPCPAPGEQADVRLLASANDVRRKADMSLYDGELEARLGLRVTDLHNGPGADEPGTTANATLAFAQPCAAGACSISTTANALLPGLVGDGERAIWELGAVEVRDGGADGLASSDVGNTPFLRQALFVP